MKERFAQRFYGCITLCFLKDLIGCVSTIRASVLLQVLVAFGPYWPSRGPPCPTSWGILQVFRWAVRLALRIRVALKRPVPQPSCSNLHFTGLPVQSSLWVILLGPLTVVVTGEPSRCGSLLPIAYRLG